MEWCIRQLWCSSIILYNITSIAYNHYTNIYPLLNIYIYLQPTVFDSDTFVVWSEEAFQLWTAAWAELYDDETDSSALLYEIHDTYFLVAIIDNEYIESDLYVNM